MHPGMIEAARVLFQPGVWTQMSMAAWRPLLDPLPVDGYWLWLMLPMALAVATVYKAIKLDDLSRLPKQALWLAVQFVIVMMLAAGVLWLITEMVGKT